MSKKSNNQGRAYEFACLLALYEEIKKVRLVKILDKGSYKATEQAWRTLSNQEKSIYRISAKAAIYQLFRLEPRILEVGNGFVELSLQADAQGIGGDVRDILIFREDIMWEIGLSLKHNHFAVKHSRLSRKLDFGLSWYGVPCSKQYWEEVTPIFDYLSEQKSCQTLFRNLPNKEEDVYIPILKAFMGEVLRQSRICHNIPSKIVEYLLGRFDFYKVISIEREQTTRIQSFNLHGTLNQDGESTKREIEVPLISLPTRIVSMELAPDSSTTVELYLDGGWQFSFRIHNAEKIATPTLKFDIQIVGIPTAIMTINCIWKDE